MIDTTTLSKAEIEAMMYRVNKVPMMNTLDATCHARGVKSGKHLCVAEADLLDQNGRKVAIAQDTYARLDGS